MNPKIRFFASALLVFIPTSALHLGCSSDDPTPVRPSDAGEDREIANDAGEDLTDAGEDGKSSHDAGHDADEEPDADRLPTCAAKGGSCEAVIPDACANGTVDPDVSDCGHGKAGSLCCVPKTKKSCESLCGKCTPVVPGSCADGTIDLAGDCGGIGSSCCVPDPS